MDNLLDYTLIPQGFDDFTKPWLVKADGSRDRENWFEALIYLWVTFNAWLAQIIVDRRKSQIDRVLVNAAARDRGLADEYDRLLEQEPEFEGITNQFHEMWPVFKVRTLSDKGVDGWGAYNSNETRSEYRKKCFAAGLLAGDFGPRCYLDHQSAAPQVAGGDPAYVPTDWAHMLGAIYQVRCNLFHGGKSFQASKDKEFARLAFEILWRVWGRPQLYPVEVFQEYTTYKYERELKDRFKQGELWRQWAESYPELFDEDDLRVLKNQAHQGYHFHEWLAAVRLYEETGYLSLVEKYQFGNHLNKIEVIRRIGSRNLSQAIEFIQREFDGRYGPDLLVYAPDGSQWFFCEVKGPRDRIRHRQKSDFERLAGLIRMPIRLVRLVERR